MREQEHLRVLEGKKYLMAATKLFLKAGRPPEAGFRLNRQQVGHSYSDDTKEHAHAHTQIDTGVRDMCAKAGIPN